MVEQRRSTGGGRDGSSGDERELAGTREPFDGRRVHLDTDVGGDIDDLDALAMVLRWPGAELVGVTTVLEDAGQRAGYARYVLDLVGRSDVPVAAGADVASGHYRVRGGVHSADYWPEPIDPKPGPVESALALLERSIEMGATIVAIGPYTNLALLEERRPGILREASICLMGGYLWPPREGFPPFGNRMDWNVQEDAPSAYRVLQASRPTLVPLTVTVETALRHAYLPCLRRGDALCQILARQAEACARDEGNEAKFGQAYDGLPDDTINFLHDPLACAVALGWRDGLELCDVTMALTFEDGWLHEREATEGTFARVVTGVDARRFEALWLETVLGLQEP
jgi:purine nucleosidase